MSRTNPTLSWRHSPSPQVNRQTTAPNVACFAGLESLLILEVFCMIFPDLPKHVRSYKFCKLLSPVLQIQNHLRNFLITYFVNTSPRNLAPSDVIPSFCFQIRFRPCRSRRSLQLRPLTPTPQSPCPWTACHSGKTPASPTTHSSSQLLTNHNHSHILVTSFRVRTFQNTCVTSGVFNSI